MSISSYLVNYVFNLVMHKARVLIWGRIVERKEIGDILIEREARRQCSIEASISIILQHGGLTARCPLGQ